MSSPDKKKFVIKNTTSTTKTEESIKNEFTIDELTRSIGIQQHSKKFNVKAEFDKYV